MDELVYRDVVRKYLDPQYEWLSKISSKEYHKWKTATLRLFESRNLTEVQKDEKIREEIELKERQYQRYLREWKENRKRNRELDIKLNNTMAAIQDLVAAPSNPDAVLKNNGLTKQIARDMGYGSITADKMIRRDKYEPVTASTKTILTEYGKPNKNGRIYAKDWHEDIDWMHGRYDGKFNHPDPQKYPF